MKKIIYTFTLISTCLFTSCNQWLDVKPEHEVAEEDMYKNSQGFYNVLNGIYLEMGEPTLYGANLSWGGIEAWASVYKPIPNYDAHKLYEAFSSLNYKSSDIESWSESVWQNAYKNIARCNNFIQNGEARANEFFKYGEIEKRLLLGEAYAIRAMLHFDVVRVFAQSPQVDEAKSYVPFVHTYPSKFNPPQPTTQVLDSIEVNLRRAADLVAAYDTLENNRKRIFSADARFTTSQTPDWGKFYSQRGTRLNYYAIKVLQGRVALYRGRHQEALDHVKPILDLIEEKQFALTKESSSTGFRLQPKLMEEVLFALSYEHFSRDITNRLNTNENPLSIMDNSIYRKYTMGGHDFDVRIGNLDIDNNKVIERHLDDKNQGMINHIPMIRLSEVLLIAAEAYTLMDKRDVAIEFIEELRDYRGMMNAISPIPSNISKEDLLNVVVEESRKEFLTEGQLLFVYKRLGLPIQQANGGALNAKGKLLLPIPESESAI